PVTYGWQLNATNTGLAGAGIDRTTLPTFTGTITPGMTLSKVKITSSLDLSSIPNVTLDRVWLAPTAQGVGRQTALVLGAGTVIKDSDIDGTNMITAERDGIWGDSSQGGYTIARVNITQMSVGAWIDGNGTGVGTMTDTYIHDMNSNGGQHVDGFTRRSGTAPLTITRSRIDPEGQYVTGAFFLQNTWGGRIAGITVKDTSLEGMGYTMVLQNYNNAGTSASFDNVRSRPTGWGPITDNGLGGVVYTSWSNVYLYDGTRLPYADGAALSHP
ncbi:MAG: hypothetical protein WCD35_13430, partial [Mycobacteriales bacterium]